MSKKLSFGATIIVILFVLSSCTTQKFGYVTTYLDYSAYTKQGFFLTELESVPFDYDAIGSITVTEISGKNGPNVQHKISSNLSDEIYAEVAGNKIRKNWRFASAETALAEIVLKAKKAGGNGLVALKTITIIESSTNKIHSVTVSGMVIRRK